MRNLMFGLVAALATVPIGSPALQAATITLTYAGYGDKGRVDATLNLDLADDSHVELLSGQRNGVAIVGLSGYAGADNTLNIAGYYLSYAGLSYWTSEAITYNIYRDGGLNYYEMNSLSDPDGFGTESQRISRVSIRQVGAPSVPETGAWAMMILGFAVVGAGARARRKREIVGSARCCVLR